MKKILYLVIWSNGHEEKFYINNWIELTEILLQYNERFGLPDLIYRKT